MKVWQIATGETGRDYSSLFLEHDIMIIGPSLELGDASVNPEKYCEGGSNSENRQVYNFVNKPESGDRVIMRLGKKVIAIGQIPKGAENQYSYQMQFKCVYGWELCHTRRVLWTKKNIPDSVKKVFATRKQIPSFTEVHEPLNIVKEVETFNEANFNRPLKQLPSVDYMDYSEDELGRELFKKGISNKNIEDIIKALNQADRLTSWYNSKNSGRYPTENEVVSHIILPIFLGLGWSHQQIAVEWKRVDMALFKATPTTEKNCVMIVEAKGLGKPLGDVIEQPLEYMKKLSLKNVKIIVTTDGANVFLYAVENGDVYEDPVGFFNVNHLQKEYVLPSKTNLVDTLVMLQPSSL